MSSLIPLSLMNHPSSQNPSQSLSARVDISTILSVRAENQSGFKCLLWQGQPQLLKSCAKCFYFWTKKGEHSSPLFNFQRTWDCSTEQPERVGTTQIVSTRQTHGKKSHVTTWYCENWKNAHRQNHSAVNTTKQRRSIISIARNQYMYKNCHHSKLLIVGTCVLRVSRLRPG